ncbi:hypothetical protein IWX92DRAFT_402936 [Phyllosticta citricarpa]
MSFVLCQTPSHENAFIREPYSLKYNATGSLQAATLHRSESSQSPTPYFDVKKYGCANDHALSQLIQARKENMLPTRHNSKFGRALHKLLVAMGESNALVSLGTSHCAALPSRQDPSKPGRSSSQNPRPSSVKKRFIAPPHASSGQSKNVLAEATRSCLTLATLPLDMRRIPSLVTLASALASTNTLRATSVVAAPNAVSIATSGKTSSKVWGRHFEPLFIQLSLRKVVVQNFPITETFSIVYSSSSTLFDATLRRSSESLSPTAFWDVKKYGIHGISQLPHFRKARRVASLRNQFNSDLGKAVADLFIELGRRKQTRKLKLRFGFELPDTCDLGQWNCIHTGSGLSELMRPMARLHGLKDFNVRIEFREGWGNGPGCGCEPARMILEGVVRKLKSQVGLYRAGCNRNLDITCDCLNCFPALEGHRNRCFDENGGPQVEEEFDKQAIQLDIDKVELETHHIEKAMERNF